jgi:hypothetical protein
LSILRDDRLVALHDLVEACRNASRHHLLAAELMVDDPRAGELRALAEQRGREADFFGERMIAEDDIPGGPPEERSLLESALARAKGALTDAAWDSLVEDCRSQEEALVTQAEEAAKAPLRNDEKQAARALAEDARRRLESFLKI